MDETWEEHAPNTGCPILDKNCTAKMLQSRLIDSRCLAGLLQPADHGAGAQSRRDAGGGAGVIFLLGVFVF